MVNREIMEVQEDKQMDYTQEEVEEQELLVKVYRGLIIMVKEEMDYPQAYQEF
jgi:hypothetical protein